MAFELFFFKALDLGFVSFEHLRVYGRWTQEAVGAFLFSGGGGGSTAHARAVASQSRTKQGVWRLAACCVAPRSSVLVLFVGFEA